MDRAREARENTRAPINYVFFSTYFAIVASLHIFHVLLIEPVFSMSTWFFATYALAQAALETLILVFMAGIVKQYFPRLKNVYIVFVFFLFLVHLIDFPLVRMMDMTFWFALNFITQESYDNFFELLLASNVSLVVWAFAAVGGIVLLMSGIFLYRITHQLTKKRLLFVPFPMQVAVLVVLSIFLISWDIGVRKHVSKAFFDRYQKTLPWKTTFFPHKAIYLSLAKGLPEPVGGEELMRKLDSRAFSLAHKPDIYLFVAESLREDYINDEYAPFLSQFKKANVKFDMALSNANATHLSWFSLFHSRFPFYYGKINPEEWKSGSVPLMLLKKMGYKIFVSSSSRLSYYNMDRVIFGEGGHLADVLFIPEEEDTDEPHERDFKAMETLQKEMVKGDGGRLFVVFLDATHLDYSWPKEMSRFFPYSDKINYFTAGFSKKGLEGIKNRYRNALYFVDSLFGKFFDTLNKTPGGKNAVVVITGDHGEEFYDHGNLFHASCLSQPQMHIPLYYRFGDNEEMKLKKRCQMTCHMDVFPTLFHYLIGEDLLGDVLQGESVYKNNRWPYTVIARFNASRSPNQFCIHNGEYKLLAEFSNERDIFSSKGLKILSTKNSQDENIEREIHSEHEEFGLALDRIFSAPLK